MKTKKEEENEKLKWEKRKKEKKGKKRGKGKNSIEIHWKQRMNELRNEWIQEKRKKGKN